MFMFVDENPDSSFHVRPPLVACEASLSKPTQPSFLKQLRLIQQRRRLTSKGGHQLEAPTKGEIFDTNGEITAWWCLLLYS